MLYIKRFILLYFSKKFIYFLIAGGLSAVINLTTRYVLRLYYENLLITFLIGWTVGFVCAFFLYKRYVFPYSSLPFKDKVSRFFIINLIALPIAAFGFIWITSILNLLFNSSLVELLAHILVIGIPAIINFLLYNFYAFKGNKLMD